MRQNNVIVYMESNFETTCIPPHFLYSISAKYCTNFKPLFWPIHLIFTVFHISTLHSRITTKKAHVVMRLGCGMLKHINHFNFSSELNLEGLVTMGNNVVVTMVLFH